MKISQTLALIEGNAAGTQIARIDSRPADQWIKDYLKRKRDSLEELKTSFSSMQAAYRMDKINEWEQNAKKVASGGDWAVTDAEGIIISTWKTKEEADKAAYSLYEGLVPSNSQGNKVKKLAAGGQGSGCNPGVGKCGRKSVTLYHGTSVENAKSILKYGFDPKRNITKKNPEDLSTTSFTTLRHVARGTYGGVDSFKRLSNGKLKIVPGGGRGAIVTVQVPASVFKKLSGGHNDELTESFGEYQVPKGKFDRSYIKNAIIYENGKKRILKPIIKAGGQGSGCKGPDCGRPSKGNKKEPEIELITKSGWFSKDGKWLPYTQKEDEGDGNHGDTAVSRGLVTPVMRPAKYDLSLPGGKTIPARERGPEIDDDKTRVKALLAGHVRVRSTQVEVGKRVFLVEAAKIGLSRMEDVIIRLPKGARVWPSIFEEKSANEWEEDGLNMSKEEALEWLSKKRKS